jgi:hypothetical protein
VNTSSDGIAGDCKLDTKPQPQWTSNWLGDSNRNKIYTDWSKMITMKTTEPVFLGTASISNTSTLLPNIKIANNALASTQLKDVLVLANCHNSKCTNWLSLSELGITMDNTSFVVSDVNATMSIPAGEFRIYGNKVLH